MSEMTHSIIGNPLGAKVWNELSWNQVDELHRLLCPHIPSYGGGRSYMMNQRELGYEIEQVAEKGRSQ
jgi:saccharopine dehydrogenase-like NADP-dependent oxidoreductase